MKDKKKNDGYSKVACFLIGSTLTVAGFIIIPPLIKKYGNRTYKKTLKNENDKIDFDDMGPEIVPYDKEEKEEG